MIKPDEIALARRVLRHPEGVLRDDAGGLVDADKRTLYLLAKWSDRGWWEYGVSLRGGWLTSEGHVKLAEMVASYEAPRPCLLSVRFSAEMLRRLDVRRRTEPPPTSREAMVRKIVEGALKEIEA